MCPDIEVLGAVVVTVTVTVAVGFAWLTDTEVGAKLQFAPIGKAEQDPELRLKVPLNPLTDVIAKFNVPELPGDATVTVELSEESAKSG